MTWTYDSAAFDSTTVGTYTGSKKGERWQVRLLIQDTDTIRQLFQDAEIDWQLTKEANVYMTAAMLCDILVAKAGNVKSKRISELVISYSASFYRSLAGELRARGSGHQVPYAGGISIADKDALRDDSDWVPPAIPRKLDDNPAAPVPGAPSTNPLTTI